jgi:hypothetical protein
MSYASIRRLGRRMFDELDYVQTGLRQRDDQLDPRRLAAAHRRRGTVSALAIGFGSTTRRAAPKTG